MARPLGVRNADFDEKKYALIESMTEYVITQHPNLPSMRQLAIATNSSPPTMAHYFGDRTGAIIAIIEQMGFMSAPIRERMRVPAESLEQAIEDFCGVARKLARDQQYVNSIAFAAKEATIDPEINRVYNAELVETAIAAIAEKLVKTPGGPKNYANAQIAARILFRSTHNSVLQKGLDFGAFHAEQFDHKLNLLKYWMVKGMAGAPDGPSGSQAISSESEEQAA